MRLSYSASAREDIKSLHGYIAESSGGAKTADGYIARILDSLDKLLDFPELGRPRDDLRKNLRTIGFERRAIIVYLVKADEVEIVRVFYGGRNFETLLMRPGGGLEP
jgi:toxin ParE1/3/4